MPKNLRTLRKTAPIGLYLGFHLKPADGHSCRSVNHLTRKVASVQKNLTRDCFTGAIRQNELIELALTHHFDSIDVDMADIFDRAEMMGKKFACQFFKSASIGVGSFQLPIEIEGDDESFAKTLEKSESIGQLAKELGSHRCRLRLRTAGNQAFHENFELHRKRIAQLADKLGEFDLSIGLMLTRGGQAQSGSFQFVKGVDELMTLVKMTAKQNVGLVLDGYMWQVCGSGLADLKKLKRPQIVDVQLADANSDGIRCLPNSEEGSFCVEIVRYLNDIGYDGTVAVNGSPADFDPNKPYDVAAKLSDVFDEILANAGVATESV